MRGFFKVTPLEEIFGHIAGFAQTGTDVVALTEAAGRILAKDIHADIDLPDYSRSTVDGYAVKAAATFGASGGSPQHLLLRGSVDMGIPPRFAVDQGQAAHIPTGGMLPEGADAVVMIEYTEALDDTTIEIHRSVAPGQNVIMKGEDFEKGTLLIRRGQRIRPQESGLLAAFGHSTIAVHKKPRVAIISTGDEIVSPDEALGTGQTRDVNTYTLSALVLAAGGIPLTFGVVDDDYDRLLEACTRAIRQSDMVLLSGGSSVGTRDLTIEVFSALPDARVLAHGIPVSPGKPTILASIQKKPVWGLPGHVASAMIVFYAVVRPFVDHIAGRSPRSSRPLRIPARLTRNVPSAQGRIDFIRVRLLDKEGERWADPVLGKSGLINTLAKADGLIEIGMNVEGLDQGAEVRVIPV